jgi:hypothetical protein
LVVVCVVSSVAAGCGGGGGGSSSSTKSFSVKADYQGKTAYIVVSVPAAHETVIRDAYIAKAQAKARPLNVNLTEQSPQGPLDCSQSGTIGQHHPHAIPPKMRPYIGEPLTVKVYGSGLLADALCQSLKRQGL